jgi:hypothetical protein
MGLQLGCHKDAWLPFGCPPAYCQSAARLPIVSLAARLTIMIQVHGQSEKT